jgi:hypothetical protein
MSNMFRGTMLKKTPAANVAMAMSLEELDRPTYCPENVDEESWCGKTFLLIIVQNKLVRLSLKSFWVV